MSPEHRIIKYFGLEETFKDHLVQIPAIGLLRWMVAPSNLTVNVSRGMVSITSITSLGKLFQCFTLSL